MMSVPQQVNTLYRIECVIRQFDPPLTGDGLLSLAENLIDSLVGKEIILPESRRISGTCYYMYICVHTNTTHTHTHTRTHTRTHTHTHARTHTHTHILHNVTKLYSINFPSVTGFCDHERTNSTQFGDYVWVESVGGQVVQLPCAFRPGYTANRTCSLGGGSWVAVDYSDCRLRKYYDKN